MQFLFSLADGKESGLVQGSGLLKALTLPNGKTRPARTCVCMGLVRSWLESCFTLTNALRLSRVWQDHPFVCSYLAAPEATYD